MNTRLEDQSCAYSCPVKPGREMKMLNLKLKGRIFAEHVYFSYRCCSRAYLEELKFDIE
jgi:hypothetical protein